MAVKYYPTYSTRGAKARHLFAKKRLKKKNGNMINLVIVTWLRYLQRLTLKSKSIAHEDRSKKLLKHHVLKAVADLKIKKSR